MTSRALPRKLKRDAIVEALVEIRFEAPLGPEIILGRLADNPSWSGFSHARSAIGAIPDFVRAAQPNLRYQPVLALADASGNRVVKIGPQVLSFHYLEPYLGWNELRPELESAVDYLFSRLGRLNIERLGLRYINALRPDLHEISGLSDLNLSMTVAGAPLMQRANLNFQTNPRRDFTCVTRVSTPEFVEGTPPPGSSVIIDVDVFTPHAPRESTASAVIAWIDGAHDIEKAGFFDLLKEHTIEYLQEV